MEFPALIAAAQAGQADAQAQREVSSMFITIAEEDELRGSRRTVSLVLSSRFGDAATKADREAIALIDDFKLLDRLAGLVVTASSIEDVRAVLTEQSALAPTP